ncbi:MAG: hypothetical protein ACXACI_19455 [Candidatus Hodarchaeales archaeon]|jgi:hypothetical protein
MKDHPHFSIILFLKSVFLIALLLASTSRGLAIDYYDIEQDWVDTGCATLAIPLFVPSSVALRHANISTTFTSSGTVAHINSSYVLHNDAGVEATTAIVFPFLCTPRDFNITVANKTVDYLWVSDQNFSLPSPYDEYKFDAIQINVTLESQEEKIITVEYERDHTRIDLPEGFFFCSFGYILATGLLWAPLERPFEFVNMEFWVPELNFDKSNNDTLPRRIEGNYTVFSYLNNETADVLFVMFAWFRKDPSEESSWGFSFFIALCISAAVWRKKRNKKKGRTNILAIKP